MAFKVKPMAVPPVRTAALGAFLLISILPSVAQTPKITRFKPPAPKQVVVQGIVVGPDNKPVPGADVEIANYGAGAMQHVLSKEDGTFSFSTLPQSAPMIDIRAFKGSFTILEPVRPVNLHVRVRLVKDAWTSLSGRVVDPAGHPMPNLDIQAASNPMPENIEIMRRTKGQGLLKTPFFIGHGKTDANGRYVFAHIVATPHVLVGASSPVRTKLSGQITVNLVGGRPTLAPDIIAARDGSFIIGNVFGAHQEPTGKAVVTVKELPGQRFNVDAHGQFRIDNLQDAKNYTVVATAPGGKSTRMVARGGAAINLYLVEPWEEQR